jgi:hypothetical protein
MARLYLGKYHFAAPVSASSSSRRSAGSVLIEAGRTEAGARLVSKRANEGLLTAEERAEYEAFINLDDFLLILQLKARRLGRDCGLAVAE